MGEAMKTPKGGMQVYNRERIFSEFLLIGLSKDEEQRSLMKIGEGRYMPETQYLFFED